MISAASGLPPAAYNAYRGAHRRRLIAHRRVRTVPLGPAMRLQYLPNRHAHTPGAVHFVRFELPAPLRAALLDDAPVILGCDHPHDHGRRSLPPQSLARLRQDLVRRTASSAARP